MAALSVDEALARVLEGAAPLPAEEVAILDAATRVLATPLAARLTQPPFDASAMDGYAVRAADVATLPARLRVVGEAAAGHGFHGSVGPGEAVRIFTGAPLPGGADAIVIQENTSRDGALLTVSEGRPDPDHVRRRGSDFAESSVLLAAGRVLDARAATLAAAAGHGEVTVHRRPVVAILATGDELVPPGVSPGPDQIVSSNPVGLAALVRAAGGVPRLLGIARDTTADLTAKVREARDADVLVTIGGASVGDHDLVAPVLRAEGVTLDFWKIAMRPGKPMIFGRRDALRIIGLPGNPVSSLICGRVFLMPLVARLAGRGDAAMSGRTMPLAGPLGANGPRQHYMRATTFTDPDGRCRVLAAPSQDSSLLSPLAAADCLIVRPPAAAALPAGAMVPVLTLDF